MWIFSSVVSRILIRGGLDLTSFKVKGGPHTVIMLSSGSPNMNGGVPTQCINRAKFLVAKGHDVTVLCRGSHEWNGLKDFDGVDVWAIAPKDFKLGKWISTIWFHPLLAVCHRAALNELHRKRPISFVLLMDSQCGKGAIQLGRREGFKTGLSLQGTALMPAVLPDLLRKESLKWERYAFRNVDFVLGGSWTIYDIYCKGYGVPDANEMLYNAIDDVFREVSRNDRPVQRFGFVGRLENDKRPLAMIEATKHIEVPSSWRFRIIGDGSLRPEIQAAIDVHPLKSQFELSEGFVTSREELAQEYGEMDCFVWTSEVEGLGVAPVEAMATGCPVIGPAMPAGKELLGTDYPAFADVDDFRRVGLLMKRMADDADFYADCRKRGLAIAAKFRPEVTMGRLEEICRKGSLEHDPEYGH